jgi:hypothetical protein
MVSFWEIITSESYDTWFQEQTEDDKAVIRSKAYLLGELGPNLGRPHADTLKGSKKLANLKELRAKTDAHVFRVAYIFDWKAGSIPCVCCGSGYYVTHKILRFPYQGMVPASIINFLSIEDPCGLPQGSSS